MVFTIREAAIEDAPEMARLLTLLGHPTTEDEILARWPGFSSGGSGALVAEGTGAPLAGLATLHVTPVLHRPRPVGRITSLVVDTALRGQGLGRRLVEAAESWLAAQGCGLVEVTSNLRRTDAHAFYERIGYERTSYRFQKTLGLQVSARASEPPRR
jgi:GNAT superfamily N-acetyltransferase